MGCLFCLGTNHPCFMEPKGIVKAFPKRKKVRDDLQIAPKVLKEEETRNGWLKPIVAYVLQAGMGLARAEIFRKQIFQNGGTVCSQLLPNVTHVIVDEGMDCDRAFRLLKLTKLPQGLQLVKASWLSACLVAQQVLSSTGYSLIIPDKIAGLMRSEDQWSGEALILQMVYSFGEEASSQGLFFLQGNPAIDVGVGEDSMLKLSQRLQAGKEVERSKYLDVTASSKGQPQSLDMKIQPNVESAIVKLKVESQTETSCLCSATKVSGEQEAKVAGLRVSDEEGSDGEEPVITPGELEALRSGQDPNTLSRDSSVVLPAGKWVCAQSSESKKINHNQCITEMLEQLAKAYSVQGDKWRALGYSKAINALKSYHKPVTSYQEACKIPGIGKQMAEKIMEILESGHLRKLDHISENVSIMEVFSNIWGVGVKTAQMWYQQGFRSLDDIRAKASLTSQQVIGLKHYEDFLERMPREEAAEIEQTVREAAQSIKPGLVCMACGSFRRGKPTCGDVDVLVTHPDGQSHQGVFSKLLDRLRRTGFLTDDLVSQEDNGNQKKYLGVCQLPGPSRLHRRLDIIVVPYSEFACALLYFTGSAHFNRSMRALAKTKGMSLSEHALSSGVVRGPGGLKTVSGLALSTPTEKDVFICLGLPYREPHERDW